MLPWTKKSKKLAEDIADTFNGRLEKCLTFIGLRTCKYCVKFKFRGMRVHAYFLHPYYKLMVQNFCDQNDFSLCLPASMPHLAHSRPLENPFEDYDVDVFVSLPHHENAARKFLQTANNEIDIKKLGITKKEHLLVCSRQIIVSSAITWTRRCEKSCRIMKIMWHIKELIF